MKLETETRASLQSLLREKKALSTKIAHLKGEVRIFQERRDDISKILSTQEEALNNRLATALTRLKDRKPELFNISPKELIGKLAGAITAAFLEWLIS